MSKSKGMPRIYKCERCKKPYAMEWAKENHQKQCIGHHEANKTR